MPRGKQKSISERLEILGSEIQEMEDRKSKIDNRLKNLNNQKQELQNQQKLEQANKLLDVMESNGISPEEALAKLTGKSNSEESAD